MRRDGAARHVDSRKIDKAVSRRDGADVHRPDMARVRPWADGLDPHLPHQGPDMPAAADDALTP